MSAPVIDRPEVTFDAIEHAYKVEGEDVLGVSTIAKIGGAESTWGVASAWGFRVGYEGAWDLLAKSGPHPPEEPCGAWETKDDLREALKAEGLTPWATRDRAAERGSWVHDVLEELAQEGEVPDMNDFPEEVRGHVRSVLRWFLHFRPQFVATEVQVSSRRYGFAGRYDLRALIDARRILPCIDPARRDYQAERIRELAAEGKPALGLLDLKTSKGIYPLTHFPQAEGYELAGVEMGFPATDFRGVLNTWPDGDFDAARDFAVSWSTGEDFIMFLGALRAIRRIEAGDPEVIREKARAACLLENLPATSRELAELGLPELAGMDSRSIGMALGSLRKKGRVEQPKKGGPWQLVTPEE